PDPRLDQANQDVAAMLDTVRAQAKALQADPQRIALVAFSAGGPLLTPFLREAAPGVRCLGAFYPFLDLRPSKIHQQYLDAAALARNSPAAQPPDPPPPALPLLPPPARPRPVPPPPPRPA